VIAVKAPGCYLHLTHAKTAEGGAAGSHFTVGNERCPQGSHDLEVFRHHHLDTEGFLEGLSDPHIGSHTSLEGHRRSNFLALAHIVQVIPNQGLAQSPGYVFCAVPHLLLVNHVGLRKHSAASRNADRVL